MVEGSGHVNGRLNGQLNRHLNGHLTPDQISFYDETLKKQIEGSYRYDGKTLHVASVKYGIKSAPPAYFGTRADHFALQLYAQKLLSELARDAAKDAHH